MPDVDIQGLTAYTGASSKVTAPPNPGEALVAYFDSARAAETVDRILSAAGIPFYLERPSGHWAGVADRLTVTVPPSRAPEAKRLLKAAGDAGLLDSAAGADGLVHY